MGFMLNQFPLIFVNILLVYFLSLTPVIDILVEKVCAQTLTRQTSISIGVRQRISTTKYSKLNPIDGANFICDEGRLPKLPP